MAATAGSASTSSLVPSEVGSGRPFPPESLSPPDPTAIVEVNESQVEDVQMEQPADVPIQPDVVPVEEGVEAKSSPPKEPTRHLNYYERMALEADAQAAAAAAAADKVDAEKVDEAKGPEDSEGGEIPNHHILDPLQEKILTRAAQDAMFAEKGKGRGRGKGKGRGRGKGRGKGKGAGKDGKGKDGKVRKRKGSKTPKSSPSAPAPKRKSRKVKDAAVRTLFQSEDETWQDEPKVKSTPPLKRPAAAKTKANPKSKAKGDAAVKGEGKGVTEPKPKKTRQGETSEKPTIPVFSKCTVIPYWSRVACGLKVSALSHPRDADEGEPKQGLRQVFYIGVKGASMEEHINVIVEIAPGYIIKGSLDLKLPSYELLI